MFASIQLARRIEGAEARMTFEIARVVAERRPTVGVVAEQLSGGVAVFTGPNSPINKLIGLGFDGTVDEKLLEPIEQAFSQRKARLQAEVSTLADPSVHSLLCRRGYVLHGFENVLGIPLRGDSTSSPKETQVGIRLIEDSEITEWAAMLSEAFWHPDGQGAPVDQLPPREVIEEIVGDMIALPALRRYVAVAEGASAAGASMRVDDGVAQFSGSATVPAHRRKGFQSALIRTRLRDAADLGCDIAVVTTSPGSKSQQNLQAQGFELLYSRAILVKDPALPEV